MSSSSGDRFPLLLYRAAIKRYRRPSFLLAVMLLGLWLPVSLERVSWPPPSGGPWLFAGGVVAAAFWLFTLFAPRFAYVQPRQDHLRLRTPVYRLNISYRRIRTTRPLQIAKTFPLTDLPRGKRNMLEPFQGRTALGVDLRSFPVSPTVLRLFLDRLFLAPDRPGLILIVDDWMELSEQISDHTEGDRSERQSEPRHFSDAARILAEDG